MTKHDWLVLFVRVLGLYLIGTYLGSFVASLVACVAVILQKTPTDIYVWKAPMVSGIVLIIGLVLVFAAPGVARVIEGDDRK